MSNERLFILIQYKTPHMYQRTDLSTRVMTVVCNTALTGTVYGLIEVVEGMIEDSYQNKNLANVVEQIASLNEYVFYGEIGVGILWFMSIVNPIADTYLKYEIRKSKSSSSK